MSTRNDVSLMVWNTSPHKMENVWESKEPFGTQNNVNSKFDIKKFTGFKKCFGIKSCLNQVMIFNMLKISQC